MQQVTVAIPTMRRWAFLQKILPPYLENPLIYKVVICDETGEDTDEILKSSFAQNNKLVLHKNKSRLGMYHNKRKCLEIASQEEGVEWVSVLDSDNIFSDTFFETLCDEIQKEQKINGLKTVFVATHIVHLNKKTGESKEHTEHFTGKKITQKTWNSVLQIPKWHFLLNDGNWTAHKSVKSCFNANAKEANIRAVDSLTLAREMILGGYTYYIVPELRYIHTVHDDSEWAKTEGISSHLLSMTDWRV